MHSKYITSFIGGLTAVVMLGAFSGATPAHAQSSSLTEEQIDSVVNLLESFEADADVVEDVERTLKGEDDDDVVTSSTEGTKEDTGPSGPPQEVKERVSEARERGQVTAGPGNLPDQASDRAKHVQKCLQLGRSLESGSQGEDVQNIQEFLKQQGFFDYEEATGYFGPITEEAVKEFQESQGIVGNGSPETTGFGRVGPRTRSTMVKVTCLRQNTGDDEEETATSTDEGMEDDTDEEDTTSTSTEDGTEDDSDDDSATSTDDGSDDDDEEEEDDDDTSTSTDDGSDS